MLKRRNNKPETMVEITTLVRDNITETFVIKSSEIGSYLMAGVIILDIKEV